METIFVATTFLLLGLILGAIAMGIFIHKYYLKPDEEYDERPQGPLNMIPIPIDLSKIFGNQKRAVDSEEVSMKKIASLFEQKIEECKRNENWEKLTELTEHYNTIENWFEERKKWFTSKIGQIITPEKITCDCPECRSAFENGVLVENKDEALRYFLHETYSKIELEGFKYIEFDGRP